MVGCEEAHSLSLMVVVDFFDVCTRVENLPEVFTRSQVHPLSDEIM